MTLQKRICLVICTVLPLLTTAATLVRLWQVGVFTSEATCPPGWSTHSSTCFSSSPLYPSNWSTALSLCSNLGARLPSNSFLASLKDHYNLPIWLQFAHNATSLSSSTSTCPNLSTSGYMMRPCKDLLPNLVCQADNLQG